MADSEGKLTFREALAIALATGLFGVGAAVAGSWVTSAGQENLAKTQFLSSQRTAAYSAFVSASEDLLRAERNASLLFKSDQEIPTQEAGQATIDALGDVNVRLQTAAAMVDIVGPSEVSSASRDVEKHFEALSKVYFDGFDALEPNPSPAKVAEVEKNGKALIDQYYGYKAKFLDATELALGS